MPVVLPFSKYLSSISDLELSYFECFTYAIVALSLLFSAGISFVAFYKRFRRSRSVKVNCWFCNEDTHVQNSSKDRWNCPNCLQYNGFKEDGDYNKRIPAQYIESLNRPVRGAPAANQGQSKTLTLCEQCNQNQELKCFQLASFVPSNENNYDKEIEVESKRLEKVFDLCSKCKSLVARIQSGKRTPEIKIPRPERCSAPRPSQLPLRSATSTTTTTTAIPFGSSKSKANRQDKILDEEIEQTSAAKLMELNIDPDSNRNRSACSTPRSYHDVIHEQRLFPQQYSSHSSLGGSFSSQSQSFLNRQHQQYSGRNPCYSLFENVSVPVQQQYHFNSAASVSSRSGTPNPNFNFGLGSTPPMNPSPTNYFLQQNQQYKSSSIASVFGGRRPSAEREHQVQLAPGFYSQYGMFFGAGQSRIMLQQQTIQNLQNQQRFSRTSSQSSGFVSQAHSTPTPPLHQHLNQRQRDGDSSTPNSNSSLCCHLPKEQKRFVSSSSQTGSSIVDRIIKSTMTMRKNKATGSGSGGCRRARNYRRSDDDELLFSDDDNWIAKENQTDKKNKRNGNGNRNPKPKPNASPELPKEEEITTKATAAVTPKAKGLRKGSFSVNFMWQLFLRGFVFVNILFLFCIFFVGKWPEPIDIFVQEVTDYYSHFLEWIVNSVIFITGYICPLNHGNITATEEQVDLFAS